MIVQYQEPAAIVVKHKYHQATRINIAEQARFS